MRRLVKALHRHREQAAVRREGGRRGHHLGQRWSSDHPGAATRQVQHFEFRQPPVDVPQEGSSRAVVAHLDAVQVSIRTVGHAPRRGPALHLGTDLEQSHPVRRVVAPDQHAHGPPVAAGVQHDTGVGGGAGIGRQERPPSPIGHDPQQFAMPAGAHPEQGGPVARVFERPTHPAIDDGDLAGLRVHQSPLGLTLGIKRRNRQPRTVPAHDLLGGIPRSVQRIGAGVVRVGGDQPDALALAAVRGHLARQPPAVRRVHHPSNRALDGKHHIPLTAAARQPVRSQRSLNGPRVPGSLGHHAGEQRPIR